MRLAIALLLIGFSLWSGMQAVRNGLSGTIIRYLPQTSYLETAVRLTPNDPTVCATLGQAYLYDPDHANPQAAQSYLQQAVELAPGEYRYWMAYTKALERNGNRSQAAVSGERATTLAPKYFEPRWQLANLLLRDGKFEAAAVQFREALTINPTQTEYTLELIRQTSPGNLKQVEAVLPDSDVGRVEYCRFLFRNGFLDQGTAKWLALPVAVQTKNAELSRGMVEQLLSKAEYDLAWQLWSQNQSRGVPALVKGHLNNGNFGDSLTPDALGFDWRFTDSAEAHLSFDTNGLPPNPRSLRITYNAAGNPTFEHLRQVIPVVPGHTYRLRFLARSENLVSGSPPRVELADAGHPSDGQPAACTLPTGTQDWKPFEVVLSSGPQTQALTVAVRRPARCPGGELCPIFGSVWLTGFDLETEKR